MISYEKELDIDNKLHNYMKITGTLQYTGPPSVVEWQQNLDC
jgi:hypothetical protein